MSGKRFQDLPPGKFAPYIAKNPETKQSELQRQKWILEVLVKAEELLYDANMGHHVRAVFGFIGFVHNPAVREVIFKTAPTRLASSPPQRLKSNAKQLSKV